MRVAVLADIHGNLPALDAVLAEAEAAGADAIVLNGDMATGPMPAQTLERLAGLGERAVWVRGNCEREARRCLGRHPRSGPARGGAGAHRILRGPTRARAP